MSIFSSGCHFVQPSENHFSNFGRGSLEELFCANILKSGTLVKDEMSFEDFLFVAQAGILFNGVEPSRPSWNCSQQNLSSFRSCKFRLKKTKVWEEMLKIYFQDGGCGGHFGFSIG